LVARNNLSGETITSTGVTIGAKYGGWTVSGSKGKEREERVEGCVRVGRRSPHTMGAEKELRLGGKKDVERKGRKLEQQQLVLEREDLASDRRPRAKGRNRKTLFHSGEGNRPDAREGGLADREHGTAKDFMERSKKKGNIRRPHENGGAKKRQLHSRGKKWASWEGERTLHPRAQKSSRRFREKGEPCRNIMFEHTRKGRPGKVLRIRVVSGGGRKKGVLCNQPKEDQTDEGSREGEGKEQE